LDGRVRVLRFSLKALEPSPSQPCGPGPSLSRFTGEGFYRAERVGNGREEPKKNLAPYPLFGGSALCRSICGESGTSELRVPAGGVKLGSVRPGLYWFATMYIRRIS
jgi:hypothetical protein